MNLLVLIPLSLAMGLVGVAAFLWAMRHNQFEDLDGASWRVLMSEPNGEQEAGALINPKAAPRKDTGGPGAAEPGADTSGAGNPGSS